MIESAAARRYAAGLTSLVHERGKAESVCEQLAVAAKGLMENDNTMAFFDNPRVSDDAKKKVVAEVLQSISADSDLVDFFNLLIDQRRMSLVGEISRLAVKMTDEMLGRITASAVSAREITDEEKQRMERLVKKLTGSSVRLECITDPSLIGGVVIRYDNTIIDGSVRGRLHAFQERFR